MAVVGICTPFNKDDEGYPQYYQAMTIIQNNFPQHRFIQAAIYCNFVSKSRDFLVEWMRQLKVDVLWFIDCDVIVPPNAGVLVQQALAWGVVSGVYFGRRSPYIPCVFKYIQDDSTTRYQPLIDEYPKRGLTIEDAVGMGCICIRLDVFERLEKAWEKRRKQASATIYDNTGDYAMAKIIDNLSPWYEFLSTSGEDYYFCERLKDAGIDLLVNWDVKCKHIGPQIIDEDLFLFIRKHGELKFETMGGWKNPFTKSIQNLQDTGIGKDESAL